MLRNNNVDHMSNKFGRFKIFKTTYMGNCFFSALFLSEMFDVPSEEAVRDQLVEIVNSDEHLDFEIWDFYWFGETSARPANALQKFRKHVERLALYSTWVDSSDLYLAAVAFRMDLISINQLDESIVRPWMNNSLYRKLPVVKDLVVEKQIIIGNIDFAEKGNRPNHYVYLRPVRSTFEPLPSPSDGSLFSVRIGNTTVTAAEAMDSEASNVCVQAQGKSNAQLHVGRNVELSGQISCDNSATMESLTVNMMINNDATVSSTVNANSTLELTVRRGRNVQQVVRNVDRVKVAQWMIDEEAQNSTNIPTRATKEFPVFFRSPNANTNTQKAIRWFKDRHTIVNSTSRRCITSNDASGSRVRCFLKTKGGRGRKRAEWVAWLHAELLDEFERLSSAGVKFSNDILRVMALKIISESTHDTFNLTYIPPNDTLQRGMVSKINYMWIALFLDRHDLVTRAQTGKLMVSAAKQLSIEQAVAYHLGCVKRDFDAGVLDENMVENIDETHFVVNMDNKKTIAVKGTDTVKYQDVVSGGEGMTLVVRITGGAEARVHAAMMIFQNKDGNYPIRGLIDDVPGTCYRTGPRGWMDKRIFAEYMGETKANPPDRFGRQKVIFMDNCGGHNATPESQAALAKLNAVIRKLPPNATDLCQPADSFIISKVKDAWSRRWDRKKVELIGEESWSNTLRADGSWSGKLKNPGKRFFLELAAKAVEEVNKQRDIKCGLSKDAVSGLWKETQLFQHLQVFINKHREFFDGTSIPEN